jgi:hypothetical protein
MSNAPGIAPLLKGPILVCKPQPQSGAARLNAGIFAAAVGAAAMIGWGAVNLSHPVAAPILAGTPVLSGEWSGQPTRNAAMPRSSTRLVSAAFSVRESLLGPHANR